MKDRPILLGSLAAGLLASACCIGPLILGAIGLGSLGFAAWLAPARPWFLALTGLLLAIGFYLAYRPVRASACEPGQECERPNRQPQRVMLWTVTVVAVGLATYPSWGARLAGGPALSGLGDPSATVVTLEVNGMTCEACEGEIARELRTVPGVVRASVDYERSQAEIVVANGFSDPGALLAAVRKAGYQAKPVASSRPSGSNEPDSGLAGQWRGRLKVSEEGQTAELIVDVDQVAGRWTGQFDLPDFGVEDYPVEVTLVGRHVTLHLSAAKIEFTGDLNQASDVLAGLAATQGQRDSLVLRRVGKAVLSEEFLRLEALAGDSTRVEPLSTSGAELRSQFNDDRAHTRLLMLLSPT